MKITLHWKYLKYDIDSETWKSGESALPDSPAQKAEAQVGDDSLDVNYVYRKVQEAVAGLHDVLHKFMVGDGDDAENDAVSPDDSTKWEFDLSFDARRNVDSNSLVNACHKYVVEFVLSEWAKVTVPALESVYIQRLADSLKAIEKVVYRKEAPTI